MMVRGLRHGAVWLALWVFWVVVSRGHHPTLFVDTVATGMLMLASAAAFYANTDLLIPRFWLTGRPLLWALYFAGVVMTLAAIATVAIATFYDAAWGPDPTRYSPAANLAMETVWIVVHALGGLVVLQFLGGWKRRTA